MMPVLLAPPSAHPVPTAPHNSEKSPFCSFTVGTFPTNAVPDAVVYWICSHATMKNVLWFPLWSFGTGPVMTKLGWLQIRLFLGCPKAVRLYVLELKIVSPY